MFSGTTIDDLIKTVEKSELRMEAAATVAAACPLEAPKVEIYPAYSTYVYQWPRSEQVIGVA